MAYIQVTVLVLIFLRGGFTWDCPDECQCARDRVACVGDPGGNGLNSVPENIHPNTTELFLMHQNMSDLKVNFLPSLSLQKLAMTDCGIKSIESEAFNNAGTIVELDLRSNKIQELDSYIFSPMRNLKTLVLDRNDIRLIKMNAFNSLNLTKLSLEHNEKLTDILPGAFLGAFVHTLYLNNASLSSNSLSSLQPLSSSLKVLSLINNQRSIHIPKDLFKDFQFADLILNNNFIKNSSFLESTVANDISLQGNPIGPLYFSDYPTMSQVRIIRLQNTHHSTLRAEQFEGLTSLEQMYLSDNGITSIPREMQTVFRSLDRLVLEGNPLYCTCELLWFRDWLQITDVDVIGAECGIPERDSIVKKPAESFTCIQPTITELKHKDVEGNEVELECIAEGDPHPSIAWISPEGEVISEIEPLDAALKTKSSLTVRVSATDLGVYSCQVNNAGGNASLAINLKNRDIIGSIAQYNGDASCNPSVLNSTHFLIYVVVLARLLY